MIYVAQYSEHPSLVAHALQTLSLRALDTRSLLPWSGMGTEMKNLNKWQKKDADRSPVSLGLISGHISDETWLVF